MRRLCSISALWRTLSGAGIAVDVESNDPTVLDEGAGGGV